MSLSVLLKVLLLSFFRYAVFVLQFYLLSLAFGATGGLSSAFMVISNVYLFSVFLPSATLGEPAVRLFLAGFIVGPPGAASYMAAIVLLWGINVGLPSMGGAWFIARKGFGPKPAK